MNPFIPFFPILSTTDPNPRKKWLTSIMSILLYILVIAAVALIASSLVAVLRSRKNSMLSHQYAEALLAENNGEADKAIKLYQNALRQIGDNRIGGDKRLMKDMERRLRTLQISTEFEQSFRRKIVLTT
jgi:ABC-type transport system involved in multi-copper enzyme maturation permease subunit